MDQNSENLLRQNHVQEIMITVHNDLGFSVDCRAAFYKAFEQLEILGRAHGFSGTLNAFCIRPHSQYDSQVCKPYLVGNQGLLSRPNVDHQSTCVEFTRHRIPTDR